MSSAGDGGSSGLLGSTALTLIAGQGQRDELGDGAVIVRRRKGPGGRRDEKGGAADETRPRGRRFRSRVKNNTELTNLGN